MSSGILEQFKQEATWTHTIHQMLLQGLGISKEPVHIPQSEVLHMICNILSRMTTTGLNQVSLWEDLIRTADLGYRIAAVEEAKSKNTEQEHSPQTEEVDTNA